MNWHSWVYDLLRNDTRITDLVPADRVHLRGHLSSSPEGEPFIVAGFAPTLPGPFPGSQNLRLQVWAHERGSSYVRIDPILQAARDVLRDATAQDQFISAVWEGDSEELVDDAFNTLTRNATFRLAAKEG